MKRILILLAFFLAQPAMAENIVICAGSSTMSSTWLPTWNARGQRNRDSRLYDERIGNGYAGLCDRQMLPSMTNATVINLAQAGANAERIRRSDPQQLLPAGHTAQSQGYDAIIGRLRQLSRQGRLRPGRDRAIVLMGITNDANPINAANTGAEVIARARQLYGNRVGFLVEQPPTFAQVNFARQRDFSRNRATLGPYWGRAISRAPIPPANAFDAVNRIYLANLRGHPGVAGVISVYVGSRPNRDTLDGVHLTPQRMRFRARAIADRLRIEFSR